MKQSTGKMVRPFALNYADEIRPEEIDTTKPDWLEAYENSDLKKIHDRMTELLNSGHSKLGRVAFGAIDAEQVLERTLEQIDEILVTEMGAGRPKKLDNLTPKQMAIMSIDDEFQTLCADAKRKEYDEISVSMALGLGAALMRLATDNPGSELAAKLDKLLGIDFSREAERGMERVIGKRNKKKQDARKSSVESKRKESAIAMMKRLVPEHGQVEASEKVLERMNRGRVEPLGVKAGTVRRWYNARLEEEREARKAAAAARLGRCPS